MPSPTLSVVIPVFNEAGTIATAIERVRSVPVRKEIIAIDDASTDATRRILLRLYEHGIIDQLVLHDRNYGKATAVRSGIKCAQGEVIAIQDVVMEYEPGEVSRLLQPILEGRADVVFGSRAPSAPQRARHPWEQGGSRVPALLASLLPSVDLGGMESCYKLARADLLQSLPLCSERFGLESELTARLAWAGARIQELPFSYSAPAAREGKKPGWREHVTALWYRLRWSLLAHRSERLDPLAFRPPGRHRDILAAPAPTRAAA